MQEGLLLELAVALYAQEVLPFGKARELAGSTRREFARALGQRGVARHYGKEELDDDLTYARISMPKSCRLHRKTDFTCP